MIVALSIAPSDGAGDNRWVQLHFLRQRLVLYFFEIGMQEHAPIEPNYTLVEDEKMSLNFSE
ncbi:hypothetical protein [Geobacillus sp. TFV-3]|uniref:hypothetical protein n=1 Tax=Geobacillus sp. TFV-3 TaxID=1897059 RepID=UPI00135AFE5E|nr:hypothetical protein [Geobacillus sp. TFV-3]